MEEQRPEELEGLVRELEGEPGAEAVGGILGCILHSLLIVAAFGP